MNRPWYECPCGCNQNLWRETIKEVASLTGDAQALAWVATIEEFWDLMYRAGILVGSPKPPPEEQEALYAQLDIVLGVSNPPGPA